MILSFINIRKVPSPLVFNTSLGTLENIMNGKSCLIHLLGKSIVYILVRTKNQKSRLVLMVQAFCEEKGLRSLSGVFLAS